MASRKEVQVKNIFVGNLAFEATESEIGTRFEPYGAAASGPSVNTIEMKHRSR